MKKAYSVYFSIIILSIFLCFIPTCQKSQERQVESKGTFSDSRANVEAMIRFLSDDLLKGRGTPGHEIDIAALYLANELRAMGWQPASGDSHLQTFTIHDFFPQQAMYNISINGHILSPDDFSFLPMGIDPISTPKTYDMVFAGYGIYAPERDVDDFEGVDIKDKAVISLLGAPWELDPHSLFGYDMAIGKSVHVAVRQGGLLVYVTEDLASGPKATSSAEVGFFKGFAQSPMVTIPEFKGKPASAIGATLMITPSVFDKLLAQEVGGTYQEWKERLSQGGFEAQPLKSSIEIHIDVQPRESQTSNVVGVLRGTDPELRDEWIVLTAHYDHLGYFAAPDGEDGIFNGADDNASGTAAVLEIARRLAQGEPLRRSVLVALVTGEERGLLGSAYFAANPTIPYESIVININADMVGRSDGTLQAVTAGCDELFEKTAAIGQELGIKVIPDPHPQWRLSYFSDGYHFARFDIPAIFLFTDLHQDYHQPSDEIQLIRFEELEKILDVMYKLTYFYTQGGEKPTCQRPIWFKSVNWER
ncbi:M28 family peptidase [Acidobacteriota bacterium]